MTGRRPHQRERDRRSDDREYEDRKDAAPKANLNEYFIKSEGINREVLQAEICRFLGSEAISRPAEYEGQKGYMIRALRPFTSEMLKDLRAQSAKFEADSAAHRARGGQREVPSYKDFQAHKPIDTVRDDYRYPTATTAGYPPTAAPYGQPTYGMSTGGYMPPQNQYPGSSGGYEAPSFPPQGTGYPPGFTTTMGPGAPNTTSTVDNRYPHGGDTRYGQTGYPPYGTQGAQREAQGGYYPPQPNYGDPRAAGNDPSRLYDNRGELGRGADYGDPMTGVFSAGNDPYGASQPYRGGASPYDPQSGGTGGGRGYPPPVSGNAYPPGGRRR